MNVLVNKSFWCNCTMENVEEDSAWNVSSQLRQSCYGILLGPEAAGVQVKEYVRQEAKFDETTVSPIFSVNGEALPAIGKVNALSEDVRRQTALKVLNSDKKVAALRKELVMPAAALRSWVLAAAAQGAKMEAWEVTVFVTVALATKQEPSAKKSAREDRPAWITNRSLHRLAQYQTMLECAELVNEALGKPLECPLTGEVFDGVVAGRLYREGSKGASVSVLCKKVGADVEQFTEMYNAIVEGIEDQLEGEVVYEGVSAARSYREKPIVPGSEKIQVNSKNVFMAMAGDSDEEEAEPQEEVKAVELPAEVFAAPAPKKEKKKTKEEEDIEALMAEMEAMEVKKKAEDEAKAAAKAAKKKAAKEKAKKK
jgi:hypothetical protein